jgi:hypothetical protein
MTGKWERDSLHRSSAFFHSMPQKLFSSVAEKIREFSLFARFAHAAFAGCLSNFPYATPFFKGYHVIFPYFLPSVAILPPKHPLVRSFFNPQKDRLSGYATIRNWIT